MPDRKGAAMYINTKPANSGNLSEFPAQTPIGMCYVPFQQWETPYDENVALERGTMFPSLDLPFLGKGVSENEQK